MKSFATTIGRGLALPGVAVLALGSAGTSFAQNGDANETLEEITVTAERREASVQDIPISIVALTGTTLENRGVKTFEGLQYQVPSVNFVDNGNTKYINIRGVGMAESAPNQTNGVAVHLDGAYIAREFLYGDAFFDLENVTVLRGPQGTYSGQNASGGAIFITSRKPEIGETDGFVSAEYGDYDLRRFQGGISFPISDSLAARVSGDWEQRDSFYENHGPVESTDPEAIDNQPGNLDRSMSRIQLLYEPSSYLEARLIYEVSDNNTDGVPFKPFPVLGSNELPSSGLRELNYDIDGYRHVSYDRVTATLDWAASEAFRVLANVSYIESEQRIRDDSDQGSAITDPTAVQDGREFYITDSYWSGELNLVSEGDGPLEWTVGASMINYDQGNVLNFFRYNNAANPNTSLDPANNTRLFLNLDNVRDNWAVFGEVGYEFTDALQLKVGARYNEDEVGFLPSSYLAAGPGSHYMAPTGPSFPPQDLLNFDATTGRVLLSWNVSDDGMFYGTVSRGYKPGGTTPFAQTYEEETVLNREIGWKGTHFGGALTSSIAVYSMDYDGFQRTYSSSDNPTQSITYNVGGSTIEGIEAQFMGAIGDLIWDVSFAYNNGEYGDLSYVLPAGAIDGVNPTVDTDVNLEGEPLDYLPEVSWNLGLSYEGWEVANGRLIPTLRVSHQDEFYTEFYHFDFNQVPSKTITDLIVAYEADNNWRFDFYVKNLADKDYISRSGGEDEPPGYFLLGAPRQIGVKLRYDF